MKHKWLIAVVAIICNSLAQAGPVNINAADAATLAKELKGIGDAKAAAIVEYRQKHGPFRNVEELALVKGIGQKFIDKNRVDLRVSAAAPAGKGAAPAATAAPAQRKP